MEVKENSAYLPTGLRADLHGSILTPASQHLAQYQVLFSLPPQAFLFSVSPTLLFLA